MNADLAGLRVGLVGPLPPPAGGMAMQTEQLSRLLRGAGAIVEVVQNNPPYRPAWVGRWPVLRAAFRLLPYVFRLWRAAGRSDLFHVMANSGWSWHLFAAPAVWIAWLRGVPVLVNYRGGEAATFMRRSARRVRFTLRRAAGLVVPSGFLQEVFSRHGVPSLIVPNIVDLACFSAEHRQSPSTPHLLVARNLERLYDNATALHAFALVRRHYAQARMTIAGTGPEAAALQTLAGELGVRDAVHFAGRMDREAMASLLRQATVAVNPSRADNMPNSVLEALASGVPVVSTAVGGVPYVVVDGQTALLVPPGDAQAMASAIERVLREPALATRLSEAGLREVRRYSWDQVAPRLTEVYLRAVSARAPQPARPA